MLKVRIEDGEPDNIFQALQKLPVIEVADFLDREKAYFEIQARGDESMRRPVFQLCVSNGWTLTEMTPVETKLEDVFRDLTMN